MTDYIFSSLEFGAYTVENKIEDKEVVIEKQGKTYDICDELGENILDYRIKKISYALSKREYINKIKIEYLNKKDGTSKFCETPTWKGWEFIMEEIDLEDDEEITNVKVYLKDIQLKGFEIITNKGKNKKIGFGNENQSLMEKNWEKGKKIVVGFGFNASRIYGVYSMHFYYIDKNNE